MQASEIRRRFLRFFGDRGHEVVRSSSLIPHNDPTLYFVNAGMVQFKDVFTGQETREIPRATTSQKCLRVAGKHNDLDAVGRTPRHHTFFEMLGNFSFGDYFKAEAIPMAWSFLTEELQIDAERLWVTVFEEDDEAWDLWRSIGFPEARLQRMGAKENFWSMGPTGPCGPCAEIHYDHGAAISSDTRGPAGEDGRYIEIWNLVFMQYEQHADGSRTELPRPSIDTGAGLERLAAVKQGVYWNYDTDLFEPLIARAQAASGLQYGTGPDIDTAMRVVADHARATAFLIADGVMPGNTGRSYVLRRIMRRAIRFGAKVGINKPFFHEITDEVIRHFSDTYPELTERQRFIDEVVRGEEDRFRRTLVLGNKRIDGLLEKIGSGGTLPGDEAFMLYDTYGFPLDLTELICAEREVDVDHSGFEAEMEQQRQRGRSAWKGSGEEAIAGLWHQLAEQHGPTTFTGYKHDEDVGTVISLVRQTDEGSEQVEVLEPGERGVVLLDRTPFYAESGGQVGDIGQIASFTVEDTVKASGLHLHQGIAVEPISVGDSVQASADGRRRDHTRRNHTATHLLHAALRGVLGEHVTQKGSLVGPYRLRFDFSHHKGPSPEELAEVEALVNREILKNSPLETSQQELDEAIANGAMALFGEKYDARVRVVSIPGFSVELCGGTHVSRTGDIGFFKLLAESGIASGVRRIEAITGVGAMREVGEAFSVLQQAAGLLNVSSGQVSEGIERLFKERRELDKEIKSLKKQLARQAAGDMLSDVRVMDGVKVLAAEYDGDLREQADRLRDQLGSSVVVLAARRGPKVQLLVATSKDLAGSRVHAGKVIAEIAPLVDGRGGGRPDLAQAGGKNPEGIPAAIDRAYAFIASTLA